MNYLGRVLCFERLERRDLLAVIRLVDWNTANRPNDAGQVTDFTTVLQAIGNETVQGNTKRLDILALQETDPAGPGGNSIGQIENILDALYPSTNYSSVVSTEDGGGDATGFVFDTSTVSLLESIVVSPAMLTHDILRAKFRPTDTLGESDFYVYSVHLKADDGDPPPDDVTRGNEALVLRADANSLGEGAHVLIVGDFNMKTSSEPAYGNLLAAGAGQVLDVAGAPGNWVDNPAFKTLHSQDPSLNMDDRFDIHFASGEFFDEFGLDYVDGSYHVFGNNGTHTLGQPITTGTGASPAVLSALAAASDHLPVIADYEMIPSTPNVRITQTLGGTKVIEGGLYDTYYVVLDTVPAANVDVTVTPNAQLDVGNGLGVAKILTFTPANALTPQVVVVNAVDDALGEGNHTGSITHSSASIDLAYNGLTIAGVTATIVDNDAPTIVINEIDADQDMTDTMEFVELYDGGVGNTPLSGMTVVFFNGNSPVDAAYATFNLAGRFTDANGFFLLASATVSGVDLAFTSSNALQNGADAVALYSGIFGVGQSPTTANLLDAIVYDTGEADDAGLLVLLEAGQPQVNENENAAGTSQSLSRVPDGGTPRQTTTYVAQAPTPDARNQPMPPGVLIVQSGTRVDVAEGGATDSYQIALTTIPTANVEITIDPDGQTNLGAGAGAAIVLTFTPANALVPQTVNVTAVDDAVAEGVHTSVITHTASGGGYNGVVIGNVVANVTDNDFVVPPVIVMTEIMYNPATSETGDALPEWLEVVNAGTSAVDLGGWMFDDEDPSNWGPIPLGTILNPGQAAVFFDSDFTTAATFRSEWTVPASALVVGISWSSLANDPEVSDEMLELLDNSAAQRDFVDYDDNTPWPPDNNAASIYLKGLTLDNNNGANWARSAAGAARAVSPIGPTFSTTDVGSPGRFFLPGDYNLNGVVDAADMVMWRDTLSSNVSAGTGADGDGNGIIEPADYDLWRANFGNVGAYYSGGAGAGAGAGAGNVVASGAPNSAVAAVVSEVLQAEPVVADDEGSAVDAAVIDFAFDSSPFVLAVASKAVLSADATNSESAAVDLLLVVDQPRESVGRDENSDVVLWSVSDEDRADIDEFFASLEDWEVGVVGGGWN